MWEKFFPDRYYDSIFEIPYNELKAEKINTLIFDVDNTLAGYLSRRPPEKTASLLLRLRKKGFKVALLSNNSKRRLSKFNENLQLPAYHKGLKPFGRKAKQAMKDMGALPENTAIIGDQTLTDVWCGKRLKLMTILVKPIPGNEAWAVRIKRGLEKSIVKSYLKNQEKK